MKGLTYSRCGDYYIPDLKLSEQVGTPVGKYMPPHFGEVTLTPEEQEELRKREERKDKLHQNYLRRKASGAQKAWEKRYNAKRKARIEAAKAAIREEDISNGVFIPVGQLPQQVPQKAPVQAHAAV